MAPQVVNMELLLSTPDLSHLSTLKIKNHLHRVPASPLINTDRGSESFALYKKPNRSRRPRTTKVKRKYSATSVIPSHDPINFIQNLLFPVGASKAYCNEETLSSSFLILDGFMTISLGDDVRSTNRNRARPNVNSVRMESSLKNATERWGKHLESNICVGKVSYEYRESDEVEKTMSHSSEEEDEDGDSLNTSNRASILSQHLEKIPLILDEEPADSGTLLDPDRYLPPSHKMVADALKYEEYDQAVEVYEDILEADKERYGESDLVCAIDYHNLGVASILANDLDSALYYFQEAIVLKRALLGQVDPSISESLIEIGIILYNRKDTSGALRVFKEALEIYKDSNMPEGIGRVSNNIGCVYYQMGDMVSSLEYLQRALVAQRMDLGMSEKAESSLLSFALTQSNLGYLKLKAGHLDASAMLEESLLVLESVLGDEDMTVERVKSNVAIAKQSLESSM